MDSAGECYRLEAHEAGGLVRRGELRATELVAAVCRRMDETEPYLHAYITRLHDDAMAEAQRLDADRSAGKELGPLAGIPVAVKDNICTAGIRTTCASRMLHSYRPPFEATVLRRLRRAGAIAVGKANLDEFAMGSSTEYSAFGPSRNPWDMTCVPGGSSGGTTVAVSAGSALAGLGSDTGGSVRLPAAFCGVVGLRPTYGLVSRHGLIAFASSMDQIGPVTRSSRDCALLLDAIAGHDARDSTNTKMPDGSYMEALNRDVSGLKIGVPRELLDRQPHGEVRDLFYAALALLDTMGMHVEEISLPHSEESLAVYYLIANAEAGSNLARFDGIRYGGDKGAFDGDYEASVRRIRNGQFGEEVKRRILIGTHVLRSGYSDRYYLCAQRTRALVREDFQKAFSSVDLICTPTASTAAFGIGERMHDPIEMYQSDVYTIPPNLAGLPSMSLPCGFVGGRLPAGLQLTAAQGREDLLLSVGGSYENASGYVNLQPSGEQSLERG